MRTWRPSSMRCRASKRSHSKPLWCGGTRRGRRWTAGRRRVRAAVSALRRRPRSGRRRARSAGTAGEADGVGRAGRQVAAAEAGRDARRGAADDRQREQCGGTSGEVRVLVGKVRLVEAGARRDLGDGAFGGRLLDAAGAAAVDEFEVGQLPDGPHDRGAPPGQLQPGLPLHGADDAAPRRTSGRDVSDTGDLRLVGHQPDQVERRPLEDALGERADLGGGTQRGAQRTDPDPSAEGAVRGVDVDADADLPVAAASSISSRCSGSRP